MLLNKQQQIKRQQQFLQQQMIRNQIIRQNNEKIKQFVEQRNEKIKQYNEKSKRHLEYKNQYPSDLFEKLSTFQRNLKLEHGIFLDEYPEQMMAVRYLTGNEKVLEIGGNIGRNSLIIASILNNNNNGNFVTLECDKEISNQLIHNKNINNLNFFVENSALSKRKLIQKAWETIVSEEVLEGYKQVDIIDFDELKKKYNIDFDTLVLDCEGAFYYILLDMPEIIDNINLIIMENDYLEKSHKDYIDEVLTNNGFKVDYVEGNGWGHFKDNFYEVWKRI